MKNLSLLIFLFFSFCAFAQVEKSIPPPPSPPKLVNDYVGILTPDQVQYLENKLVAYDDSTSSQIAIVIVEDLGGYAAVDYSVALGRKWGVGGTKSNGIVILVSTGAESGQRDAFISIGYGLEGAIPDMIANAILESELIPNLKKGEYYTAFDRTTSSLIQAAAGEYKAPPGYGDRGKGKGGSGKLVIAVIILFIILSIFGGGRNKGGGFMSRRGYRGFSGPPVFFPGGWGSGGGGGGFGGGGGGFGGFGGGSFGGGGAGGNW